MISLLALLLAVGAAAAPAGRFAAVNEAVQAVEQCRYWAGEAGSGDAQREKDVEAGAAKDCKTADRKVRAQMSTHPDDRELARAVVTMIFLGRLQVADADKRRWCALSAKVARRDYKKTHQADEEYRETCPIQGERLYR